MKRTKNSLIKKLGDSPINYWSDLFIVAMVVAYIVTILAMTIMAMYSTIANNDNSIWSDLGTLVAVPLSCGSALWMVKNGVVHALSNKNGCSAEYDFPKVNAEGEEDGFETIEGEEV